MNIDELPFKIGMQYENWEFDLDIIETEKYDKYRYNKNDLHILLGLAIQDVFLTFDLDILFRIEITLEPNENLNQLKKSLNEVFVKHGLEVANCKTNSSDSKSEFNITWRDGKNILILINDIKTNSLNLYINNEKY